MNAAPNELRRRAEQARRLANGVTSQSTRDSLLEAAIEYERQAVDLERALGIADIKDLRR